MGQQLTAVKNSLSSLEHWVIDRGATFTAPSLPQPHRSRKTKSTTESTDLSLVLCSLVSTFPWPRYTSPVLKDPIFYSVYCFYLHIIYSPPFAGWVAVAVQQQNKRNTCKNLISCCCVKSIVWHVEAWMKKKRKKTSSCLSRSTAPTAIKESFESWVWGRIILRHAAHFKRSTARPLAVVVCSDCSVRGVL